jgi:hypothetical protein
MALMPLRARSLARASFLLLSSFLSESTPLRGKWLVHVIREKCYSLKDSQWRMKRAFPKGAYFDGNDCSSIGP